MYRKDFKIDFISFKNLEVFKNGVNYFYMYERESYRAFIS